MARQVAARAGRPAVPAADPILAAKITAPGVPPLGRAAPADHRVARRGYAGCPLTVVTGPPGAGKTMALALWAAAEPRAVAWVGLDRYDNQPGAFWSYVVAALSRSGLAIPRTLTAAARERAADHLFLLRLVSALAAQDPPVILVLDDFHLLAEPDVLRGLDFVLRNVGPGLRVVVSSRMDPPLRLHRYRLAGELTEIRASDLAFNVAEAGLLMTQHGGTLSADSLECLTRRTEGWAAGLRLAAISMDTHPDPDQFVEELITEDSALTGYLVEEVLNTQPPEVREVLLSTSILEQVSAEAASELAGSEQAAGILPALARVNAFIQPIGSGWYRYHTLFAEVLRLKLRHKYPERLPDLHRRAARLYERNGSLIDAVRHAAKADDWPLAASMVIGGLAIGEIIEPRGSRSLASEFSGMPDSDTWNEPHPYLVSAAAALAIGQHESSAAALAAAEGILERLPADQQAPGRLAAAMIRLTAARRTGDLTVAAASAARAEVLVSRVPADQLARHPEIRARVLAARGAVELWSGQSRGSGPCPGVRGGGRIGSGSGIRTSRLPRASRAGGSRTRPAGPRCGAGRPGSSGLRAGRAALACSAVQPGGTRRTLLGAPGAQRVARGAEPAQAGRSRPRPEPGQADRRGGPAAGGLGWPGRRTRPGSRAVRGRGQGRVAGPGLARAEAEPGRVAGMRGRR